MNSPMQYLDQLLFIVLPYVAFFTFFLLTVYRYNAQSFTYSSLSSQLLENQEHFWSLVPFHYGIITILAAHIIAFLIPRQVLLWNSAPLRLYILEIGGLIFGLLTLAGLFGAISRRLRVPKVRQVTSPSDWILYILILIQVVSGVYTAVFYPWGSSWYAAAAAPYLWSIAKLNPNINFIVGMPFVVKLHIVNAFLLIGFFPFTRLVHILVVPNPYLWRKPQLVRWNWNRRQIRQPR